MKFNFEIFIAQETWGSKLETQIDLTFHRKTEIGFILYRRASDELAVIVKFCGLPRKLCREASAYTEQSQYGQQCHHRRVKVQ